MPDAPQEPRQPSQAELRELLRNSYAMLGYTEAAMRVGVDSAQLYGKWCSTCRGVWFGLPLEVQCPRCGNRKG